MADLQQLEEQIVGLSLLDAAALVENSKSASAFLPRRPPR